MTELQQEGVLSTLTPEQTDKLFHSPAMRRLFQKNASDEYALIWLLSKHMKDSGSEKIYLKDMVREMNLPLPKVTAIARSLQNKGLVTWTHDGNGKRGPTSCSPSWPSALCGPAARRCTATTSGWSAPLGRNGFCISSARSPSWKRS